MTTGVASMGGADTWTGLTWTGGITLVLRFASQVRQRGCRFGPLTRAKQAAQLGSDFTPLLL